MKETITLNEVPFSFPFKKHMENATIKRFKDEISEYYYMTSPSIHLVYSYKELTGKAILITELSVRDVFEALESEVFKNKVIDYLGVS